MKHRGFIFFILILLSSLATVAKQFEVSYADNLGKKWRRWIIVEAQEQNTVFLVVDNPLKESSQRLATQIVVERKLVNHFATKELLAKINYYKNLKDLKSRSNSFYIEAEEKLNKTPTPIWTVVKSAWSVDDENKFSDWFKKNASTKMAVGSGLEFDCADFGLLGRWIYAHDNQLPIANSLVGSGKLFGHFSESKNWSQLPTNPDWKKDERFKAALRYLFDSTYTRSIINDLYPVKISKEFVTPGSIILTLRSNGTGHTQVIYDVGVQNYCGAECVSVLYGNQPSRDYAYKTQADIRYHSAAEGGFLRWRWPQFKNGKWQLAAKASMPGFSLEQYENSEMSFDEFNNYVYESLGFKVEPFKKAYSLANSLYNDLNDRLLTTAQGAIFCHYQYCDPLGADFDQYSTPSKDKRFREKRDQLLRLLVELTPSEQYDLISLFKTDLFLGFKNVPVTYSDYIFNANGISDSMSSDPSATFEARWGLVSLNDRQKVMLLSSLFMYSWQYRSDLVTRAVRLCGGGQTPTCDPGAPDVTKLSTATLDSSLRAVYKETNDKYQLLSNTDKRSITYITDRVQVGEGCSTRFYGYCVLSDYLFQGSLYIDRMSSDPTHSLKKRMGLE